MTQPDYVPVQPFDRVREQEDVQTPGRWRADRPAEISSLGQPRGHRLGNTSPDAGYALKLARLFEDRLIRDDNEDIEDIIAGCCGVALKRASIFRRAPVIYDLEFAFTLWGFLGGAPDDLVVFRKKLFQSASHHYWDQRDIVDHVKEEVFHRWPNEIRSDLGDWTSMIDANLAPNVHKRTTALKALADMGGEDS